MNYFARLHKLIISFFFITTSIGWLGLAMVINFGLFFEIVLNNLFIKIHTFHLVSPLKGIGLHLKILQ